MTDEDKRHELQLLLLREGYTQEQARDMATGAGAEWVDGVIERMREDAMRHPERQIVPPGTVDLHDVKSAREDAEMEAIFQEDQKFGDALFDTMIAYMDKNATRNGILEDVTRETLKALVSALGDGGITITDAKKMISECLPLIYFMLENKEEEQP